MGCWRADRSEAVRMNAGGHGSDMQACVQTVKLFDLHSGDINTVVNEDLDFGPVQRCEPAANCLRGVPPTY